MSREKEYNERVAINMIDGGMSEPQARCEATEEMGDCTQKDLPDVWRRLNSRWHALATETYGRDGMQAAHGKLKSKHRVESFTKLTVGQIKRSVDRISEAKK